ncbi:efflux transporter outer membrane subunit [Adhaeribacter pallidiroseus]|uniref:Putative efflux pump outer membrane protein SepC n=1 Tax=Adhaeribacter pallidiroseus TaxID=2072847 RepID=A0A369QK51_9BACT|nr:efflux transporter outer membrane subunit [Adhaeribacter pallidiroseus]RDC63596.1 putative efflux pump outer membrane protein SepC [Adhaeribacter pallidiroseus]
MRTYRIGWTYLLVMLVVAACKVSEDKNNSLAIIPEQFRNAPVNASKSIADIKWKNFFTEATLQRLIDSAIAKNYDMQVAVKNIEAANLRLRQSKWNYVPDINLQVSTSTNRPSDNSVTGLNLSQFDLGTRHINDYTTSLGLSWEADIWGKIRNQQKSALGTYLQTQEARKAIQTNIVAAVSKGFYNLLMLDAQLRIAQRNRSLNDSTLAIIRLQYRAGQVTALAVQQAEAQLQAASQLIPQFEQNITTQENLIKILSGELPDHVERQVSLDQLVFPEELSSGIPSALVSRRPDVKSNELALTVANAQLGITKASLYPALRITATGGINSFSSSNWFNVPASLFGIVGGSVLQPVLQSRRLKTNYEIAKVERDKAVMQFRQSVLTAVGETSNALIKIEKLKAQEATANQRVQTLRQATTNANQLFKSGLANYLEVITAQSNVLQSELTLATIKKQRLDAVTELYAALGGGWK